MKTRGEAKNVDDESLHEWHDVRVNMWKEHRVTRFEFFSFPLSLSLSLNKLHDFDRANCVESGASIRRKKWIDRFYTVRVLFIHQKEFELWKKKKKRERKISSLPKMKFLERDAIKRSDDDDDDDDDSSWLTYLEPCETRVMRL